LFEELIQAGPVGWDSEGHPVVLDRFGAIDMAKLLRSFDTEAFLRHSAFSREVLRCYATANSIRRQKRIYKCVSVLDMKGLSLSHNKLIPLLKTANAIFGWYYPESIHRFYVINAPWIFRTLYDFVKVFLHPVTQRKVSIVGSDYKRAFAAAGITLTDGDIPQRLPCWSEEMKRLVATHEAAVLTKGYMPPVDEAALQQFA